jgi:Sulfotransferase family
MNKLFIVGCPRSGTTMVQQALNRHSAITIPPETKFFFSFLGHSRRNQRKHLDRLNRDLNIHLELPESGIRSEEASRAFYEEMANQYVERIKKKDVLWFGEKTPEHTGHMARIRQLFPDSKILILYRDGRDVALSLSKTPWMPGGLYVSFLVWLYYQRLVIRARESRLPNIYIARYEDIVANPEKEFTSILEFLDLPYEPNVAHGYGNSEGIPQREYLWKATALQKITPNRVGTFQSELSRTQIAILERLGQHTLSSFGYPLLTNGKDPLSIRFLLKLSRQMTIFFAQLPWYSLMQEINGQIFLRLSS